jgi:UDP-N-acetylmuramoyl-L-alanyl-D-glutamate--2,6-diaminopimelate ligase
MAALDQLRARGVERLCVNSRAAGPGCAFVALPAAEAKSRDGSEFALAALAAGAPLVVGEGDPPEGLSGDDWVQLNDVRRAYPKLAAALAGDPAEALQMLGITGTDGKTSVAWLVTELLNVIEPNSTARIGTLGAQWGSISELPGYTTPPAAQLHPLLARMRADGMRRVVMEVSSHAIALGRVEAIRFDAAVLTSLGRDHLDFHGDVAAYHRVKTDWLAAQGGVLVAPVEIEPIAAIETFLVGGSDCRLTPYERVGQWTRFTWHFDGETADGMTNLIGALMLEDLAFAMALVCRLGFAPRRVALAAEKAAAIPGRFEPIGDQVLVDYAHTPDALALALKALRPGLKGRLIVVFGAGGDRDRGKRPAMAAAAEANAELVLVTSDNPRFEDPEAIIDQICAGFRSGVSDIDELGKAAGGWSRIGDRRAALQAAVRLLRDGDLLLVAGKGAEGVQIIAGTEVPFDDRAILRGLLEMTR